MIGFIGTFLQLQLNITAHTLNSFLMKSVLRIPYYSRTDLSYYLESLMSTPWIHESTARRPA
jgi:hypothetical protein